MIQPKEVSPDVQEFLNSLYDLMIVWNSAQSIGELGKTVTGGKNLRNFLQLSPKDFLDFNSDPEGWAPGYIARGGR
jgi:hypothetical protein